VDVWEIEAREGIRDIVTRYNSNGDTGRFRQVLELFAEDAVMELRNVNGETVTYSGLDEIATIFTGAKERFSEEAASRDEPNYVRHWVSTHQIDLLDEWHAAGRCYFQVLMAHGLDHWGRYLDQYERRGKRWVFTHRLVIVEGNVPRH
jgi:3-phenylpropionate/cinnamic acid dioxygenase small subunit